MTDAVGQGFRFGGGFCFGAVAVAAVIVLVLSLALRGGGVGGTTFTGAYGGGVIQSMGCPTADTCIITASTGGSQSTTATLTPAGVQQLTAGKFTSAQNLEITIGPPNEWAVYGIVQQPGPPPVTLRAAHLTGWDTDTTGTFYWPIQSAPATATSGATWVAGTPSSVGTWSKGDIKPDATAPATHGCNVYKPNSAVRAGESWNWNVLVRTAQGAFATFYEYECASAFPVGVWGTLNGPQYGTEATIYLNGQAVKVGNGNFGAAPKTASLGIGTVTYDNALGTGLGAPTADNFAAVLFFDDNQWRVVPVGLKYDSNALLGGPVNAYLNGQAQNTIPSSLNPVITPISYSAGIFTAISNFLGSPSDADRWAAVNRLASMGSPTDVANINLRSFQVGCGGGSGGTLATSVLCALSPAAAGDPNSGTVTTPAKGSAWSAPVITLTLNAAGIQSLGIKSYGGTPANVQAAGTFTAANGGVYKVTATNIGPGDGNFQFSAVCPGAALSSVTLPVANGATVTANLAVASTGTIATATTLACTASVTDLLTGNTAQGTGPLAGSGTPGCIGNDLQQTSTQTVSQCQNGQFVQIGVCGAGQAAVVSGSSWTCVSTAAQGGALPPPGPTVQLATAAPGPTTGPGPPVPCSGLRCANWPLILGVVGVVAAVAALAVALRRGGGGGGRSRPTSGPRRN